MIWTTEFGRQPFSQGADGRDHNGGTFVTGWPAPASRAASLTARATSGRGRASNGNDVYDLHATILHLLGIDHERLTFRHNGTDRRLTDVHGHVIRASPRLNKQRRASCISYTVRL